MSDTHWKATEHSSNLQGLSEYSAIAVQVWLNELQRGLPIATVDLGEAAAIDMAKNGSVRCIAAQQAY